MSPIITLELLSIALFATVAAQPVCVWLIAK